MHHVCTWFATVKALGSRRGRVVGRPVELVHAGTTTRFGDDDTELRTIDVNNTPVCRFATDPDGGLWAEVELSTGAVREARSPTASAVGRPG